MGVAPRTFLLAAAWIVLVFPAHAGLRPVHTYSIVARDSVTGDFGVAVQSHWFAVGQAVIWAEAGVGAVATQSFADPSYGQLGLEMMRTGRSAPETLQGLLAADVEREGRQVAMVDAQGRVAVHTGNRCIASAGHVKGDGWSVQANLMLRDTVWGAMAKGFQSGRGDLAERLLLALEAAEAEGGDIRGKQSAALLVVRAHSTGRPWEDRLVDLRVDDHPEPLKELRRLLQLHVAYRHMIAGDEAMVKNDMEGSVREYGAAAALVPNPEMLFWHGIALAASGRVEEAKALLARVYAQDANWRQVVERSAAAGLMPGDANLVRDLTEIEPSITPATKRP